MRFFNKHYLFAFSFIFVITFSFVSSFYEGEYPSMLMGVFYGLVFIPMFFFLKHRKNKVDLKLLNVYAYLGFMCGFIFLLNEEIGFDELVLWSTSGIPFAIAFNLFCLRFIQKNSEK